MGVFRMLAPRSHGGLEIDFPATVDVLAELAGADGATGWTSMIGCETPQLFALLPRASFDAVYASGPDVICAGAFAPQGSAELAGGVYRASGRWGFASGCQHADWLFGQCVVTQNGVPTPGPVPGAPALRCVALPAARFEILDTWNTSGMRGTGSHDIALRDADVPAEWTFDLWLGEPSVAGPLFAAPTLQFSLHIGAVALGIAEGALGDLAALAGTSKKRLYARAELADQPLFQYRLGHAEADARAARAARRLRGVLLGAGARRRARAEPAHADPAGRRLGGRDQRARGRRLLHRRRRLRAVRDLAAAAAAARHPHADPARVGTGERVRQRGRGAAGQIGPVRRLIFRLRARRGRAYD